MTAYQTGVVLTPALRQRITLFRRRADIPRDSEAMRTLLKLGLDAAGIEQIEAVEPVDLAKLDL
jgi:hypothetical protein